MVEKRAAMNDNNVQIQFYGAIREAANKSADDAVPGLTVLALLQKLADGYGPAFRGEIFEEGGGLRDDLTVTVNGVIVSHEATRGITTVPGDVIALLPVFPGGG